MTREGTSGQPGTACPYCGNVFGEQRPRTKEHVWPKSLGGDLAGDQFVIEVCEPCNSTCGIFVDAQFTKSPLVANRIATDGWKYADVAAGRPLPLSYIGELQNFDSYPYDVADLWLSPCRGTILHLHPRYEEKWATYAGGNPLARKADPGAAIFMNRTQDREWLTIGLRSFREHFGRESRFVAGVGFADPRAWDVFGSWPDARHQRIVDAFQGAALDFGAQMSIRADFDQRFLAKVALGFGTKFLGPDYRDTEWARVLRQTLWAKSLDEQEQLPRIASSPWDADSARMKPLAWEGGVSIALGPGPALLVAMLSIFAYQYQVVVSDDPSVWAQAGRIGDGQAWVIVPQRSFFHGPMEFASYVDHQQGNREIPALVKAARWRSVRTGHGNCHEA